MHCRVTNTAASFQVGVLLLSIVALFTLFSACRMPAFDLELAEQLAGVTSDPEGEDTDPEGDIVSPNIGTLRYVPAGSFQRDVDAANVSIISQSYYMSEHEITRSQFSSIMGTDPSDTLSSTGVDDPVQSVNWYDAIAFANKLSIEEGLTPVYSVAGITDWETLVYDNTTTDDIPDAADVDWNAATADWGADGYRLPTEMEWMWAAMGATKDAQPGAMQDGVNRIGYTKEFAGDNGSNVIDDYAWWFDNSTDTTSPVGTKNANELGLHDVSGNVLEWVWDGEGAYPSGELTDYRGAAFNTTRVMRGGSHRSNAADSEVASRINPFPEVRFYYYGFRLVRP